MITIYLIRGESGRDDDYVTWTPYAYGLEKDADAKVKALNQLSAALHKDPMRRYESSNRNVKMLKSLDPDIRWGDDIKYTVQKIELIGPQ